MQERVEGRLADGTALGAARVGAEQGGFLSHLGILVDLLTTELTVRPARAGVDLSRGA